MGSATAILDGLRTTISEKIVEEAVLRVHAALTAHATNIWTEILELITART